VSYDSTKLSNFISQSDDPKKLKDYLLSVDKDLQSLFLTASTFYQFGTGSNFSILTYSSTNYVWFASVGAWSITNALLYGGSGSTYIGLQPGVGIWMGDAAFANAIFSVVPTGQMKAHAGRIGGWYIGTSMLSSTNLTFDSTNEDIQNAGFVSGALGSGFQIKPEIAEFQNIRIRGKVSNAVFERDVISSVGGNLLVADSDILDADMTALDTSTVNITSDTTFAVNDILRIKDGVDDEWMEVTAVSHTTYTVVRDKAGGYAANSNPTWQKGTAVVNFGANGEGLIFMTASENNSPYLSVVTHSGTPWTTLTTRMRLGNLNGYLGYNTDKYGIAIGEATKYLKYDPVNGLQIAGTVTLDSTSTLNNLAVTDVTGWAHGSDTTKIDGGKVYTNSITTNSISATAITTEKLAANSITATKYNELRNTYVYNADDSLDASYNFIVPFKIVSELLTVQSVKLSFKILNFRAYSTAVASGGGSTSGATGSASGGGDLSGTGGGDHTHGVTVAFSGAGSNIWYSNGALYAVAYGAVTYVYTSSVEGHSHYIHILQSNSPPGNLVYFSGAKMFVSGGGEVTTSISGGHSHTISLDGGTTSYPLKIYHVDPNYIFYATIAGTISNVSYQSQTHTHTTPDHTHPNHTHTTPNHTHSLGFGIFEDSQSPTINYYIDNGAGYGGASGNITTDQTDIDITASISGVGWKAIKFTSTTRCRIAAIIEVKLDISA